MASSTSTSTPSVGVLSALFRLIPFLGRRPGWVALSLGLLLINIAIELALPQILGRAITLLDQPSGLPFSWQRFVVVFLGLVVIRTLVGMILGPIRNTTVQRTMGDVRSAVYDAIQRQCFAWHDNARTGELISRASTDINRLQEFFFVCLLFGVDVVVGMLGTLVLVFWTSPQLGWLTLLALAPAVGAMGWFAVQLQPRWRKVHDRHSAMSTVIQENIAGVRVVKAFARESAELVKFQERKKAFLGELSLAVNYWAARVPFAQFLFGLGVPLVLWVGGHQVLQGRLVLGDLAKVVFYLLGLGGRMGVIGQITTIIQNAGSSAQRVDEILHARKILTGGSRSFERLKAPALRFENVSFHYDREPSLTLESETTVPKVSPTEPSRVTTALHQIHFEVPAGKTVAVVGATAAGKSTLLALIPRFYDTSEGRVLVDGQDVREFHLQDLRRSIGMVFQETFLFSASVADNIAFGRPEASREEILRSAQVARAHGFIMELPQGYDTVIGERGISLSGGQRQRIAIARALLGNPGILLLDDATSAVDSQTEREIREAIRDVSRGRTTVLVSQRVSSVRQADLIVVLHNGRLVEQGTHDTLVSRRGTYYQLFQHQLEES